VIGAGRIVMAAAGISAAAALGGCGDDGKATSRAAPAPTTMSAKTNLNGKVIALQAPASVAAGAVTVQLSNAASAPIGVEIIRVDGDQTGAQVLNQIGKANGPIPAWIHGAGGPGVAPPRGQASGTQILQPGTHYLIAERDDDQGKPLAVKLEVTGEVPANAALPKAAARIVADEYSFKTTGLTAGRSTVAFDNAGRELHHALAFPIVGKATLADVGAFFKSGGESGGPPPVDFERSVGTPVLDGGAKQTVDLAFEAGRYALVCFLPDRAGSPPHVALGMLSELTIQ
jgi:hypothetical protein